MPRRSINTAAEADKSGKRTRSDSIIEDAAHDVDGESNVIEVADEQTNASDKEEEKVKVRNVAPTRRTRRSLMAKKNNKALLSSIVIDSTSASDASESEVELKVETKPSSSKFVACLSRKRMLR